VTRAEPISALYEQHRVHHVGTLGTLEDQMCDYDPKIVVDSPDRMDAVVWTLTELSEGSGGFAFFEVFSGENAAQLQQKMEAQERERQEKKALGVVPEELKDRNWWRRWVNLSGGAISAASSSWPTA